MRTLLVSPNQGDVQGRGGRQTQSMGEPISGRQVCEVTIHGALSEVIQAEFADVVLADRHRSTPRLHTSRRRAPPACCNRRND
jgi:hypothetical protein